MTPQNFIEMTLESARNNMKDTGIFVSFTIAQAALESGWGTSQQCLRDFNYFGVKAIGEWKGPTEMWPSREVVNGHSVMIQSAFRKYGSITEGFEDHAAFLTDNKRYAEALRCTDSIAMTRAVAAAGYATDPHYAINIILIINKHNLQQYDT